MIKDHSFQGAHESGRTAFLLPLRPGGDARLAGGHGDRLSDLTLLSGGWSQMYQNTSTTGNIIANMMTRIHMDIYIYMIYGYVCIYIYIYMDD